MGGVTFDAIRTTQEATLRATVPTLWPALKRFEPWNVVENFASGFVAWADQVLEPFRVFDIEHGLDLGPEKYLDEATDLDIHTETVLVAYPQVREYEGRPLDDVIEQDLADIDRALGLIGGEDYETLGYGLHRCELTQATLEDRAACKVLRLVFELEYDRSMA